MEIERVDFRDAIKILAEHARIDISKYQHNPEKFAEIQDEKEKIKRIHHLAYEFFLKSFEQNKNAQKYVYDQRHIDKNLTNVFQVGYAPDSHYDLVTFLKEK
jgi:DNA primase